MNHSTATTRSLRTRMRKAVARELRRDNPNVNSRGLQAMAGGLLRSVGYDVMRVEALHPVDRRCLVWNVLGARSGVLTALAS